MPAPATAWVPSILSANSPSGEAQSPECPVVNQGIGPLLMTGPVRGHHFLKTLHLVDLDKKIRRASHTPVNHAVQWSGDANPRTD